MIKKIIRVTLMATVLLIVSPMTILIRRVFGFQNIPKKGPLIIIANHPTKYDPFLIYVCVMIATGRHVRFVTGKKLYNNPIRSMFFWMIGSIKVAKPKRRTIINASSVLKKGGIIGIFPEGDLTRNSRMIRTGYLRLSYDNDVPIVPILFRSPPGFYFKGLIPKINASDLIIGEAFKLKKPIEIKRDRLRRDSERIFNQKIHALERDNNSSSPTHTNIKR